MRMETVIKWGKCWKLHRFFNPSFWVNNQLMTLWLCSMTWLKNWKCLDSVTLIKCELKSWRRKFQNLLKTPRQIMTWLGYHQGGSVRPEWRRWSIGRTSPKILFWTVKRIQVSVHNTFGSGGNRGNINILTMECPFASFFLYSYRSIQWIECFQNWRRSAKSRVKIWRNICVKPAWFCKWMKTWMICKIHLHSIML